MSPWAGRSTAGVAFADVALMSTVPGRGVRTPMLVSGPAAARAAGLEEWMRDHLRQELAEADAALVDRLEQGSIYHARRRAAPEQLTTEPVRREGQTARISTPGFSRCPRGRGPSPSVPAWPAR